MCVHVDEENGGFSVIESKVKLKDSRFVKFVHIIQKKIFVSLGACVFVECFIRALYGWKGADFQDDQHIETSNVYVSSSFFLIRLNDKLNFQEYANHTREQ